MAQTPKLAQKATILHAFGVPLVLRVWDVAVTSKGVWGLCSGIIGRDSRLMVSDGIVFFFWGGGEGAGVGFRV